jgi:hypothetical protein
MVDQVLWRLCFDFDFYLIFQDILMKKNEADLAKVDMDYFQKRELICISSLFYFDELYSSLISESDRARLYIRISSILPSKYHIFLSIHHKLKCAQFKFNPKLYEVFHNNTQLKYSLILFQSYDHAIEK